MQLARYLYKALKSGSEVLFHRSPSINQLMRWYSSYPWGGPLALGPHTYPHDFYGFPWRKSPAYNTIWMKSKPELISSLQDAVLVHPVYKVDQISKGALELLFLVAQCPDCAWCRRSAWSCNTVQQVISSVRLHNIWPVEWCWHWFGVAVIHRWWRWEFSCWATDKYPLFSIFTSKSLYLTWINFLTKLFIYTLLCMESSPALENYFKFLNRGQRRLSI